MDASSIRTLIVDDSEPTRKVLIGTLQRMGVHFIKEAQNGAEAISCIQREPFDLILMDRSMPVMNGIEAIKKIRGMRKTTPIIMVTTEHGKEHVLEAVVAGANNYITKPFTDDVFQAKVRRTIERVRKGGSPSGFGVRGSDEAAPLKKENELRVLVVDDSPATRQVVVRYLNIMGVSHIKEAENGKEAFKSMCDVNFDVVLMDWNMPEMDGIQAVKAIRTRGDKTPIIMVTSKRGKKNVLDALVSGANNYITKPFTKEVFFQKLRETLRAVGR